MVVVERGSRTVSRDDGDLPYGLLKTERPVLIREQAFDEVMKYLYRGVSILLSTRNPMVCLQLISTGQPEYIRI